MARPLKEGLDYFPMDVDLFDDDRIFDLTDRFGSQGTLVYLALLTIVYRRGYYAEIPADRLAGMIMRAVGTRCYSCRDEVVQMLDYCAHIGLIEPELYRRGVVTSAAIQKRYAMVTARRSVRREKYWLLDEPEVIAAETPVTAYDNPTKKTKENQTKQNEMKEDQTQTAPAEEISADGIFLPSERIMTDDPMTDRTDIEDDVTLTLRSAFPSPENATAEQLEQLRELSDRYGTQQVLLAMERAKGYAVDNPAAYIRRMLANGLRPVHSSSTETRSAPPYAPRSRSAPCGMMHSDCSLDEAERLMDEDWWSEVEGS